MSASPETSSASAPENGQGPGIIPYTGQSLGDVGEIMNAPEMSSDIIEQIAGFDIALLAGGTAIDVIFRDTAEGGFSLANMRLAPDYILPTHRHNVDCLYYVLSGSIQLGRRRIDAGGGFLVRADRSYGYRAGAEGATVLEFRHSTRFNMVVTETSPAKWSEMVETAKQNEGWPGFAESVSMPKA
ncbi:cupin domain-containing protein [Mycolicibacterium pyrenivorans]|uniref:cupin domain-containing protein n=1 Tax=Mycolicibacterium pyrenivorans TaxID=187102 RepID=UPI0021F2C8ED|nr:cupin domain-containing protein [Mycolicibacterium pyrenivorans]MCV7154216.1 cupin domain-containing protein [Mycolicibacterium pyrenivorans]